MKNVEDSKNQLQEDNAKLVAILRAVHTERTDLQNRLASLVEVETHLKQIPALSIYGVQLNLPNYLVAMDFGEFIQRHPEQHDLSSLWSVYFRECEDRVQATKAG